MNEFEELVAPPVTGPPPAPELFSLDADDYKSGQRKVRIPDSPAAIPAILAEEATTIVLPASPLRPAIKITMVLPGQQSPLA